jgi:hypothetical protein
MHAARPRIFGTEPKLVRCGARIGAIHYACRTRVPRIVAESSTLALMPAPTSPLDGSEWALLREQVAATQALVTRRYGAPPFDQTTADLEPLQRLLDDAVFEPHQVEELRALGAVFGNVLAKQVGFEWVAADDGRQRREPSLRLKPTGALVIHPLRAIVDRLEAGASVNLSHMLDDVRLQAKKTKLI